MLTLLNLTTVLGAAVALSQFAALLVAIAGLVRLSFVTAAHGVALWSNADAAAPDGLFERHGVETGWNP